MNYSKNSCTFSCWWPMRCQKWNEKLGCLFQDRKVIVIVAYCRWMCIANTLYTCACICKKYELETWSNKLQCLPAQPLLCHLTTKRLARKQFFIVCTCHKTNLWRDKNFTSVDMRIKNPFYWKSEYFHFFYIRHIHVHQEGWDVWGCCFLNGKFLKRKLLPFHPPCVHVLRPHL